MTAQAALSISPLYDRDLALWYADTLTKLKAGNLNAIDIEPLIEEIEGLAARDRREIKTRLKVLLAHLLKRLYVAMPHHYRGWESTIDEQREQLHDLLAQSPSLRAYFIEVFDEIWQRALRQVQGDDPQVDFPHPWPMGFEPEAILTQTFWAEGP